MDTGRKTSAGNKDPVFVLVQNVKVAFDVQKV